MNKVLRLLCFGLAFLVAFSDELSAKGGAASAAASRAAASNASKSTTSASNVARRNQARSAVSRPNRGFSGRQRSLRQASSVRYRAGRIAAKRNYRTARANVSQRMSKVRPAARSRLARSNFNSAKRNTVSRFTNSRSAVSQRVTNARKSVTAQYQNARPGVRNTVTRTRRVAQVRAERMRRSVASNSRAIGSQRRALATRTRNGFNQARQGVTGKLSGVRGRAIARAQRAQTRMARISPGATNAKLTSKFQRPNGVIGKYKGKRSQAWRQANIARYKAKKALSARGNAIRSYKQGISEKIRTLASKSGPRGKSGKKVKLGRERITQLNGRENSWLQNWEGIGRGTSVGHTLDKHVGQTDAALLARLNSNSRLRNASTFTNRSTAESVIGNTISANRNQLNSWIRSANPGDRIRLNYSGTDVIGRGATRGAGVGNRTNARVILQMRDNGKYHILTAFPE